MTSESLNYSIIPWDSTSHSVSLLAPILAEYYGPSCTLKWCKYKFADPENPTIAALAIANGKTVGIAAAGIREFQQNSISLRGTVSIATFVSPPHRGRGLYPKLLQDLETTAASKGVSFLFALPNQLSRPAFAKAGYLRSGTSLESVTPLSARLPLRAIRSGSKAKTFTSDPTRSQIDPHQLRMLSDANPADGLIRSALSEGFLVHRLAPNRGHSYSIATFGSSIAILMHGKRGAIRECRVLATSNRHLDAAQFQLLRSAVRTSHGADLLTVRSSGPEHPKLSITGASIVRRAEPPVFIKSTELASEDFDPARVRLTGIDTHTW